MRRANLFHGQLGTGLDSSWTRVDLRGADLRGAHAQVRFERVDFRNARFTATDWGWSDLVGCTFAGVVQGLTLGRRPIADRPAGWTLREVDLTAARPRDLSLIGVDLGAPEVDLRLPTGDEHWRITDWPAFLDRVAAAVAELPDGDDRMVATIWHEHASRNTGPRQTEGFIATWDVLRLGDQPLLDTLRACRDTSGEGEQRREHDHDDRGPGGVDRQVPGLPALELRRTCRDRAGTARSATPRRRGARAAAG